MSDGTTIEWTDATWNPVSGCTKVSDGCLHCYIERTPPFRMNGRRFDKPGIGGTTGVMLHPERLEQPYRWRKPRRVFVCSLADLFHADVDDDHIIDTWSVMATNRRHTFQVLTKRPARMRALLSRPDFRERVARRGAARMEDGDNWFDDLMFGEWPRKNIWGGVSAEDQPSADLRIPILLETPLAVRWVSAEPLLGPIDLHGPIDRFGCRPRLNYWIGAPRPSLGTIDLTTGATTPPVEYSTLDWVVSGGESGPGARPSKPGWHRFLRDQCATVGVAYHFKQWGEWAPAPWKGADGATHAFTGGMYQQDGIWVENFIELGHAPTSSERDDTTPHGAQGMRKVGKKAAGRLLDGRTHDEYPTAISKEA